jgi:hypothetical protein
LDDSTDPEDSHRHHRDFSIYLLDGRRVMHVPNFESNWDEAPSLTQLKPGSYKVRSWAVHGGIALVTVVIEAGRTTDVYLDGSFQRPTGEGSYVTLPTGEVVGWCAQDSSR